jgi:UDP-N-acetylmuramoyl-tripeptide--D-alanyl-D-alanine ligase
MNKSLTLGFIREALSGTAKFIAPNFDGTSLIRSLSTDSRTCGPDDVFVAIKGEKFDGHDFIKSVVERRCKGVICSKYPADTTGEGVAIFLVEDTTKAFRTVAQHWRVYTECEIIAVAGSVGKTTTKDLLHSMLVKKYPHALKTKGSYNGFLGIPMTLMDVRGDTEFAAVEVGIDAPGAMIQHIDVVRPDMSIVTAISEEHLEWLINLETVAREENLILQETAAAGGLSIVNLDDPYIAPKFQELSQYRVFGCSLSQPASFNILSGRYNPNTQTVEVSGLQLQKATSFNVPLPGIHNARNCLGAICCALLAGLSVEEIRSGLATFVPSGGRSQFEQSKIGTKVLCDYYNANPASTKAALSVIASIQSQHAATWLCLADMKELGNQEEALHRGLAADINSLASDGLHILLLGPRMKWLFESLGKIKCDLRHFEDINAMTTVIQKEVGPKDLLLLKGSHSMGIEAIWKAIKP